MLVGFSGSIKFVLLTTVAITSLSPTHKMLFECIVLNITVALVETGAVDSFLTESYSKTFLIKILDVSMGWMNQYHHGFCKLL